MNICAIIPVKKLSKSKLRLAESLNQDERQDLTLKMLKHVLKVVTKSIKEVLVIGTDKEIKKVSTELGAHFVKDKTSSLNSAINQAISKCIKNKHDAILYLLEKMKKIKDEN